MLSVDGTLWVPDYSKPKVGVQGLDTSTGELAKDRVPGFSFPNQRLLGGDVFFADGSTFRPLPTAVFDTGGGRLWEAASYDQVTTPLATKEGRLLFAYTSRTSGGLHLDRFAGVAGATGKTLFDIPSVKVPADAFGAIGFAPGGVIVVAAHADDWYQPSLILSGYSTSEGKLLWTRHEVDPIVKTTRRDL
jgi:hypothetical protein